MKIEEACVLDNLIHALMSEFKITLPILRKKGFIIIK